MLEQQKYLEYIRKDRTKNNIFISGIPNEITTEETIERNYVQILKSVLNITDPGIETTAYHIIKNFEPRENATTHSIKIHVDDLSTKTRILKGCKKFKEIPADHPLKKVYLKNDDPPLTRKENERLYRKVRELRSKEDPQNPEDRYIIQKGETI